MNDGCGGGCSVGVRCGCWLVVVVRSRCFRGKLGLFFCDLCVLLCVVVVVAGKIYITRVIQQPGLLLLLLSKLFQLLRAVCYDDSLTAVVGFCCCCSLMVHSQSTHSLTHSSLHTTLVTNTQTPNVVFRNEQKTPDNKEQSIFPFSLFLSAVEIKPKMKSMAVGVVCCARVGK